MSNVKKLVYLSILAALGVVLMLIEIPWPLASFLKLEVSDIVVLLAFFIFGFKEALLVAVVKTLGDFLFQGMSGPYAIGQFTALVASLSYVLGLFITDKLFNLKEAKLSKSIISYFIIITLVTTIMIIWNYAISTPVYLGLHSFLDIENRSSVSLFGFKGTYLQVILAIYIPFNLAKSSLNVVIFNIIGNRYLLKFIQEKSTESYQEEENSIPTEQK